MKHRRNTTSKAVRQKIKPNAGSTFFSQANDYLETLKKAGKYNQYTSDKPRIGHFREFLNDTDVAFSDMTEGLLKKFVAFLKSYHKLPKKKKPAVDPDEPKKRVRKSIAKPKKRLSNMFHSGIIIPALPLQERVEAESNLILKSVSPLTHVALIRYLESRGISQGVAQTYLKEIRIYNKSSRKQFFAAAIRNEEGGYDYRNPFFKGCVKKKSITFIRGTSIKPDGIHIFEGQMDFLSAVMRQQEKKFYEDVIILNSLSCMREATGYIRGYGYRTAYTWLDNDEAGKKATLHPACCHECRLCFA